MDGDRSRGNGQQGDQSMHPSRIKPQVSSSPSPVVIAPSIAEKVLATTAWRASLISAIPTRKTLTVYATPATLFYIPLFRQIIVAIMTAIRSGSLPPAEFQYKDWPCPRAVRRIKDSNAVFLRNLVEQKKLIFRQFVLL